MHHLLGLPPLQLQVQGPSVQVHKLVEGLAVEVPDGAVRALDGRPEDHADLEELGVAAEAEAALAGRVDRGVGDGVDVAAVAAGVVWDAHGRW